MSSQYGTQVLTKKVPRLIFLSAEFQRYQTPGVVPGKKGGKGSNFEIEATPENRSPGEGYLNTLGTISVFIWN